MRRPLAPGSYIVTASAEGFVSRSAEVLIPSEGSGRIHNFVLEPLASPKEVCFPHAHAEHGAAVILYYTHAFRLVVENTPVVRSDKRTIHHCSRGVVRSPLLLTRGVVVLCKGPRHVGRHFQSLDWFGGGLTAGRSLELLSTGGEFRCRIGDRQAAGVYAAQKVWSLWL